MKFKKYRKLKGSRRSRLRNWLAYLKKIIKSGYYEWTDQGFVKCTLCGEVKTNVYSALNHLRRRHGLKV
ncbi:MAG: hypothetical protein ACXQTB_04015 [Candidatus Nezhaarchaeales archaeon]